jgi:nucleoside-diphosphate-sugar epimerase
LIRKFVEATERGEKEVVVWGTGQASREFLFVEDTAKSIIMAAEKYGKAEPVHLGTTWAAKYSHAKRFLLCCLLCASECYVAAEGCEAAGA